MLPKEYRPVVFNVKQPQSSFTFTVDGGVAGTWAVERQKEKARLAINPVRAARAAREELRDEGERLLRWIEDDATSYAVHGV